MVRRINNLVALIPEWVVKERGLNSNGRKIGNGYLLSSKDLDAIEGEFFEHKVALLGGLVLSTENARRLIEGTLEPIVFKQNKEEEV